jgi:Immunity protein 50
MQDQTTAFVEGSSKLVELYGYWISFHDAAVETVQIEREGPTVTIAFTANDAVLKEGQEDRELLSRAG